MWRTRLSENGRRCSDGAATAGRQSSDVSSIRPSSSSSWRVTSGVGAMVPSAEVAAALRLTAPSRVKAERADFKRSTSVIWCLSAASARAPACPCSPSVESRWTASAGTLQSTPAWSPPETMLSAMRSSAPSSKDWLPRAGTSEKRSVGVMIAIIGTGPVGLIACLRGLRTRVSLTVDGSGTRVCTWYERHDEARTTVTDDYDLLLASDLRLPGGTTASMAEEIRAQAAVGYRTALLHVPSGLANRGLGIDPRLRRLVDEGLADLIAPGQRVSTRLAVLRNATVFSQVPVGLPISAERVAMIANHVALDAARIRHYEPAVTDAAVTAWLGVRPTWYPIGPAVRESLEPDAAAIDLAPADWFNLLDVAEWAADRAGVSGRRPVIGRHSRSSPAKWPESAHDLLAVYPEDGSVQVRVLGGAAAVGDVLGRVPSRWIVEEFGAKNPRDFVAELDFFVYFHRSDLVEAYGRTIMEAMASGAVAILPEHCRETFGDAARYASPNVSRKCSGRIATAPLAMASMIVRP